MPRCVDRQPSITSVKRLTTEASDRWGKLAVEVRRPLKKCTSALISMKRDTLPAMFNHRRQFSLRRDTPPAMFNHMWFFHFNLVHIGITTTYAGPLRNKGCEPISAGGAPELAALKNGDLDGCAAV